MSPYTPFSKRETRSSSVLAYLPADFFPTERDFAMGFEWLGVEPKDITRVASDDHELHLSIARADDLAPIVIRRVRAPPLEKHVLETMQLEGEEQVAELARSVWALQVTLPFTSMPIADLHEQLQYAYGLVLDFIAVLDVSAQKVRSATWVEEAAMSMVPPPPQALFTIHALHQPDGTYWLHTHGLERCACIELEMHSVPEDKVGRAVGLINTIAPGFIEHRPAAGTPFPLSELVSMTWQPWESSTQNLYGRTPDHQGPAAVLTLADGRPAFEGLDAFEASKTVSGSQMGTARASMLAKETFEQFVALHEHFAKDPGWFFRVKLAPRDGLNQSLWFTFEGFKDPVIDATLLDTPLRGVAMSPGTRMKRPFDELVDWSLRSPLGPCQPDGINDFEAALHDVLTKP